MALSGSVTPADALQLGFLCILVHLLSNPIMVDGMECHVEPFSFALYHHEMIFAAMTGKNIKHFL